MSKVVINLEECKWYEWDDLKKLDKLPDDLDIVQRGCISLVATIVDLGGNTGVLFPTKIYSEDRLEELAEYLQERGLDDTCRSEDGRILYDFSTDEERTKIRSFFENMIKDEIDE